MPKHTPAPRHAAAADAPRVARLLINTRAASLPSAQPVHADDEIHAWVADVLLPSRRCSEHHGFAPLAFTNGEANEERRPDVLYELKDQP